MVALKTSESQREDSLCGGHKIELRKNCSVVKYDCYHYSKKREKEVRVRGQKDYENRLSSDYTGFDDFDRKATEIYKVKTEKVFEEEKDRLARIRR